MNPTNFIEKIRPGAVAGMKKHGILASITIAQAILESAWGDSTLTEEANNLFGMKCGSKWKGEKYSIKTAEFYGGRKCYVVADFRKYNCWADSIEDHSLFLQYPRYQKVVGEKNYMKAAHALQQAGYATDPQYPEKLINLIQKYNLHKYDVTEIPFKRILIFGSTGEEVKQVQRKLKITVDGVYGHNTQSTVKHFQKTHGLTPDGIVGEKTWEKLF